MVNVTRSSNSVCHEVVMGACALRILATENQEPIDQGLEIGRYIHLNKFDKPSKWKADIPEPL